MCSSHSPRVYLYILGRCPASRWAHAGCSRDPLGPPTICARSFWTRSTDGTMRAHQGKEVLYCSHVQCTVTPKHATRVYGALAPVDMGGFRLPAGLSTGGESHPSPAGVISGTAQLER